MRGHVRPRTLATIVVGAALLLAPSAVTAARPVKPPKNPTCQLSAGVTLSSTRSKGTNTWIVQGTEGDDTIDCRASTALVGVTIYTVDGQDFVYGTPQADAIFVQGMTPGAITYVSGEAGNDYIEGGWGDSTSYTRPILEGGPGDDTIIATGGGNIYAVGGDGDDSLDLRQAWNANVRGGAGTDVIRGPLDPACGAGCSNPLFGDAGNDFIFGGPARDDIEGGPGTDEMHGADGDDLLIDSGSGAETFDCGPGSDTIQDLDGNGTGGNGTGYLGTPEDDDHVDCETVLVAASTCPYTPGTTGCVVLTDVAITDNPSTATYLISGTVTFTPTCANTVGGCSFANITLSGSGTFSVSGSQTATGTWTIPAAPNDRPNPSPYSFTDATSSTNMTCADAAIRTITFNLPLVASNGDTGGSWLEVRTDDAGTSDVVGGIFSTGPLPTGIFRNAVDSQAGVDFNC